MTGDESFESEGVNNEGVVVEGGDYHEGFWNDVHRNKGDTENRLLEDRTCSGYAGDLNDV